MRDDTTDEMRTELMRAAMKGDGAAYARLLKDIAPIIRRLARSRRLDGADAEDVVQEVLLSLHTVRHTYDPARPFMPWLLAIARHRVADSQRRQIRRGRNEVVVEVLPETSGEDRTNASEGVPGDPEALRRAIASLPSGQRQAVELLKLQELSLREASAASGMSVAALKVAMHRAMKVLRTVLNR